MLVEPTKLKSVVQMPKIKLNLNLQDIINQQQQESRKNSQKVSLVKENIDKYILMNYSITKQQPTEYYSTIFSKTSSTHTDLVDLSQCSDISDFSSNIDEQQQEENSVSNNLRFSQIHNISNCINNNLSNKTTNSHNNSTSISPRVSNIFLKNNPFLKDLQIDNRSKQFSRGFQSERVITENNVNNQSKKQQEKRFSIKLQNCQKLEDAIKSYQTLNTQPQQMPDRQQRKQGTYHIKNSSAYFIKSDTTRSYQNQQQSQYQKQQQSFTSRNYYQTFENQQQQNNNNYRSNNNSNKNSPIKKSRFSQILQNQQQQQIIQSLYPQQRSAQKSPTYKLKQNNQIYSMRNIPQQQQQSPQQILNQQQLQQRSRLLQSKKSF